MEQGPDELEEMDAAAAIENAADEEPSEGAEPSQSSQEAARATGALPGGAGGGAIPEDDGAEERSE